MNVIVIVPFRPDPWRDRLWEWCFNHLWYRTPYHIYLSQHTDGLFNRSAAINAAADGDWDIAVIADADTFLPAWRLATAVDHAHHYQKLVAPFTTVIELTENHTTQLLDGNEFTPGRVEPERIRTRDLETQSSILAVPRNLWDDVGGFDDQFQGWGGEDNAFWKHCQLTAGTLRIPGPAYHLWHPPAPEKHTGPAYTENRNRWNRYQAAHTRQELDCIRSESSPTPAEPTTPKN